MRKLFTILTLSILFSACGGANPKQTEEVITTNVEADQPGKPVVLSVREFAEKLEIPDVQLVDVRTDGEVAEGMINGATQMDISDWDTFVDSASSLDKAKPVLVYCKAGGRSARAAKYLSEKGYEVYDLEGGYGAWKRKN